MNHWAVFISSASRTTRSNETDFFGGARLHVMKRPLPEVFAPIRLRLLASNPSGCTYSTEYCSQHLTELECAKPGFSLSKSLIALVVSISRPRKCSHASIDHSGFGEQFDLAREFSLTRFRLLNHSEARPFRSQINFNARRERSPFQVCGATLARCRATQNAFVPRLVGWS
jgi:hypothetical protein